MNLFSVRLHIISHLSTVNNLEEMVQIKRDFHKILLSEETSTVGAGWKKWFQVYSKLKSQGNNFLNKAESAPSSGRLGTKLLGAKWNGFRMTWYFFLTWYKNISGWLMKRQKSQWKHRPKSIISKLIWYLILPGLAVDDL